MTLQSVPPVLVKVTGARGEGILDAVRRMGIEGASSGSSDEAALLDFAKYVQDQLPGGDLAALEALATSIEAAAANVLNFSSRAAALLADIPSAVKFIRTAGYYAAGDGGGALYVWQSSDPGSVVGKFQSHDGAWWLIKEVFPNVRQFGAKGDGSTDDSQALEDAFSLGIKVFVPKGVYGNGSSFDVAVGTSIVGIPGVSVIQNLANSCDGGQLLGNNSVSGIKYVGFGSKASTYKDTAWNITGSKQRFRGVSFDHVSGPCIRGVDVSDIDIDGVSITESRGGTTYSYDAGNSPPVSSYGALGDIYFSSSTPFFSNIKIRHVKAKCSTPVASPSVIPKDICVEVDSGPGDDTTGPYPIFSDVIVEDVTCDGYERIGICVSTEYAKEAAVGGGEIVVRDCHVYNTGSIGIKIKACQRVIIANNYLENWEMEGPETTVIGGGIHLNNGGNYIVTGNIGYMPDGNSNSTNFINVSGLIADFSQPFSSSQMIIADNTALGTNDYAYRCHGVSRQVTFANNTALNCAAHTVALSPSSDEDLAPSLVTVTGGTFRGMTKAAASNREAFSFAGVTALRVSDIVCFNAGGHGIVCDSCGYAGLSNVLVVSSGKNTSSHGILVQNGYGFSLTNSTSKNGFSDASQVYGLAFGTGNSGNFTIANNNELSGTSGAVVGYANLPSSGVVIDGNPSIFSATASWTPGSISAGSSASKAFTVTGAIAGDFVDVSIPGTGNGCVLEAVVSTDTVTVYWRNPSAGGLTPTSGTYGVTVRRHN